MSRFYHPIVHVKLTTVQRDALTAELGMEIWNTDTNQQEYYDGTAWVTSSGGSSGATTITELTDTPSNYGTAGQVLSVNNTTDGFVYSNLSTTPADIKNGLMVFVPGTVPIDTKLALTVAEVQIDFATNTPQSVAKAIIAPTSAVSFDIRTIVGGTDSSIGNIDFAANTDTGTFTVTQTSAAVGDIIYIMSPSDVFGITDLFINLIGSSIYPAY